MTPRALLAALLRLPKTRTIRSRLLLAAIVIETLMLAIQIGNSVRLLYASLADQAQMHAEQVAPVLNAALVAPLAQRDYATIQAVLDESHAAQGFTYLAVMDGRGKVVATSGWAAGTALPIPDSKFTLEDEGFGMVYDVRRPVQLAGEQLGSFQFGLDLTNIVDARQALLNQGLAIAAAEIVLTASLLTALGLWLTRHLSALARASEAVGRGDFCLAPLVEGDDDIGRLGAAFNAMSRAVNKRIEDQEHEVALRTRELVQAAVELRAAKEQAEQALADVRTAQHQLVEAEKMAALGSLVAGIAHEVNTPVGTALTAASLLQDKTHEFAAQFAGGALKKAELALYLDLTAEATGHIITNIRRAADLVRSFKQVAVDQSSASRRCFDLARSLAELLISLRPRLNKTSIRVDLDCAPDLTMDGFPGALSQIITNLVLNSLTHAYEPGQSGHIIITGRADGPDRVDLSYQDDGAGIPSTTLPRIFDPFFTTKRECGGTGLGLHIVFNNVTQILGGTITATSTEGQGTRFHLVFPRISPAARDDARREVYA